MNKFVVAILCAAVGMAIQSGAVAQDRGTIQAKPLIGKTAAEIQELQKRDLAFLIAPIKSAADLKAHVDLLDLGQSPLKALSYEARQRFIHSLTFNESGLTGFHYADLQKELSVSQIYQVLALFGKQHATKQVAGDSPTKGSSADSAVVSTFSDDGGGGFYTDYKDYKCASRATCSTSTFDICMSGC